MKTAILYTRTDSDQVSNPKDSHAGQEKELREYCEKNNIKVVGVYSEAAPGIDFKRPEFIKFYLGVLSGKVQADLFLFTRIDKFCYNLSELKRMHGHLCSFGIMPKAIRRIDVYFVGIIKNA